MTIATHLERHIAKLAPTDGTCLPRIIDRGYASTHALEICKCPYMGSAYMGLKAIFEPQTAHVVV